MQSLKRITMEEIHESECVEQFSSCYEDVRITEQSSTCDEASNHHDHCGDWWDLKTEDTTDVEHNVKTADEIKLETDEDAHQIIDESETKKNEMQHIGGDEYTSSIFVTWSSFQAMDSDEFSDNDDNASVSNDMDYEESVDSGIGYQPRIDKISSRLAETNVIMVDHSYARNERTQLASITDASVEHAKDKCKIVPLERGDPDVISVCEQCNKSFSSSDYTSHQLSHHVDETLSKQSCSICAVTFPNTDMLKKHKTQMHSECIDDKPRFCSVCCEMFSTDHGLKSHMEREHHEHMENTFCCSTCQMIFEKEQYLEMHEESCENKLYCCAMCNERFATDVKLKSHVTQYRHSQFSCSLCQNIFCKENNLIRHMATHKRVKSKDFVIQCPSCNQQFKSVASLTDHKIKEHIHQCAYCLHKFLSYESFSSHIQEKHSSKLKSTADNDSTRLTLDSQNSTLEKQTEQVLKMENCMCPKCDQQFIDAQGLNMHLVKYGANDQKVICDLCGKGFCTVCKLEKHVNVEKDVGYPCAICQESVMHAELKLHKKTHNVCTICDKRFMTKESLHQHTMIKECSCGKNCVTECMRQTHKFEESEQYYQCSVCGKRIMHKLLKRHLTLHYKTGSSYQCQRCKKTLLSSRELKRHIVLCSSKKQTDSTLNFRFKCYVCGCVCLDESSFKEHIKSKCDELHPCPTCGEGISHNNMASHRTSHKLHCNICGEQFSDSIKLKEHSRTHHKTPPSRQLGPPVATQNCVATAEKQKPAAAKCVAVGRAVEQRYDVEHCRTISPSILLMEGSQLAAVPLMEGAQLALLPMLEGAQLAALPMMEDAQLATVTMRGCPSLLRPCLAGAKHNPPADVREGLNALPALQGRESIPSPALLKKKKVPTATLR